MANTIGFGQAAVNNTIDYGQGAIDNTINWGKSQTLSPSGETNITGTGGTPPFSSVNSFLFDGVDEKMFSTANYTEINGTQNFSVSFWLKPIDVNSGVVFRFGKQGSNNRLACIYYPSIEIVIISFNTNSYYYRSVNGSIPLNQWSHIVYTYDGTQSRYNRPEIYVNGVLSQGTNTGVTVTSSTFDGTLELGGTGTSGQQNFGNNYIDEFAVWNSTTLTQTQANELYNGGAPSDLNNIASGLTSPTTWFRMGEEAVWNGFTWTMTDVNGGTTLRAANMQESSRTTDVPTASSFSNTRSIQLDGVDDYIDCGNDSSLNFSADDAFSFSVWFKKGSDSGSNTVFSKGLGAINYDGYYMFALADYVYFRIRNNSSNFHQIKDNDTHPLNTWVHYLVTYDGSRSASGGGLKLYKNGTLLTNVSKSGNFSSGSGQTIANFGIGARIIDSAAHFNGNIDEVSAFNSELSASDVTSIYNGGVPNDISSLSPLSWWRCGDGDTAPTATDSGSGGNDGTMTNFTTFSTDVPT